MDPGMRFIYSRPTPPPPDLGPVLAFGLVIAAAAFVLVSAIFGGN